jgi:hypothetical protein
MYILFKNFVTSTPSLAIDCRAQYQERSSEILSISKDFPTAVRDPFAEDFCDAVFTAGK